MPSGTDGLAAGRRDRDPRGVTVLELMITLAIVAILLALAAPSFSNFIADVRQSALMGELTGDLRLARSESIKRNLRVLVCRSTNGTACATDASTDWAVGWLVCYDSDGDGFCDAPLAATDPNPIKVHAGLSPTVALAGPSTSIFFRPIGTANGLAAFTLTNVPTTVNGSTRVTNVSPAGSITTVKQ